MAKLSPDEVQRIRTLLSESQAVFAERLGVTAVTVSRWESGKRACDGDRADAIRTLDLAGLPPTPRVFLSYAWTDESYQDWVVDLANRLVSSGVDVVFDQWDLEPGQDAFEFMESMVQDPSITHVVMLCNALYTKKANSRKGGVSTETQIISPKVYGDGKQTKFVPVVVERDENEEACLPTYLGTRLYIDLMRTDGFEQLVRHLFGQSKHPKPPLGLRPNFGAGTPSTPNVRDSLSAAASNVERLAGLADARACVLFQDYLGLIAQHVADLRTIRPTDGTPFDEAIVKAIEASAPMRNEFVTVVDKIAASPVAAELLTHLNGFFEKLLDVSEHHGVGSWQDTEYESVRFVGYELFLCTATLLVRRERLSELCSILDDHYLIETSRGERQEVRFDRFDRALPEISDRRRQRLRSNRVSLVADMLRDRAAPTELVVPFARLQETDFLLHLRSIFVSTSNWGIWGPRTLVYLGRYAPPFDLFAGARSPRRFKTIGCVLEVKDLDHLRSSLKALPDELQTLSLGSLFWGTLPLERLMGLQAPEHAG